MGNSRRDSKAVSVIIPVLNEESAINRCVELLYREASNDFEVIVVDGDPRGSTIKRIERDEETGITAQPGRSFQMNAGASLARGEILLFLHADTALPAGWVHLIQEALAGECVGGAFSLGIDSGRWAYRVVEFGASLRYRFMRTPFGDQAIFIRRDYFHRLGGYREIAIMEDAELMRRIRKRKDRICILRERVMTSPRKWEEDGILYGTLRNYLMQFLFMLGVSPDRLLRIYYRKNPGRTAMDAINGSGMQREKVQRDAVIVFMRYPENGEVKTRLWQVIGEHATALYRCFVHDTLSLLEGEGRDVFLYITPAHARDRFIEWLGESYRYASQEGGTLGERMCNSINDLFTSGYEKVILIGSDIPDLPAVIIDNAFEAIGCSGAVIGPAADGGYYLIGFRKDSFSEEAFHDIAWGTETVFRDTAAILKRSGISLHVLPCWQDVDTVEDLIDLIHRNREGAFMKSRTMSFLSKHPESIQKVLAGRS